MRPCEVGPLPNFGPQNPLLKQEEELLLLHKRSFDDPKPSSTAAQWILPSPPPTAKQQSLQDSEATPGGGRWLPISPPLTADKSTFTTNTKCQQPSSDVPSTPPSPPTIVPLAPATSNLRAIAPKSKKNIPLTIPTVAYEEMPKDTPRLIEEVSSSVPVRMRGWDAFVELMGVLTLQMKKRGQGHVEARRRDGEE